MKVPHAVEKAEERMRSAAGRGDFTTAETASLEYLRAIQLAAASLPRPEARSLIRQAMAAMEMARRQLCVARTQLARQLRALECRVRYQQTGSVTHTWRIEA